MPSALRRLCLRRARLQRRALAGTVKCDNVQARVTEREQAGQPFLDTAVEAAEDDDRPARLRRGEPVSRQVRLLVGDQMMVAGHDAVFRQDDIQEALTGLLMLRIAGIEEGLRRPGVVSGGQAPVGGQRPVAELEDLAYQSA